MSIILNRAKLIGMSYGEYDSARTNRTLPAHEMEFWLHTNAGWMPKHFKNIVELLNQNKTPDKNDSDKFTVRWTAEMKRALAELVTIGFSQTDIANVISTQTGLSTTRIMGQFPALRSAGLISYTPRTPRKNKNPNNRSDDNATTPSVEVAELDFDELIDESFPEIGANTSEGIGSVVEEAQNDLKVKVDDGSIVLTTPCTTATITVESKDSLVEPAESLPTVTSDAVKELAVNTVTPTPTIASEAKFDMTDTVADPMYLLEVLKKMVKHTINADKIISIAASCETGCAEVCYSAGGRFWKVSIAPVSDCSSLLS